MKKITTIILAVLFTANLIAQVPNYVPTNGLVGWWPFNGNANDESGNGNNGTVNGATLTTDRFGNTNKAYSFDGEKNQISIPSTNFICIDTGYNKQFTISLWYNNDSLLNTGSFGNLGTLLRKPKVGFSSNIDYIILLQGNNLTWGTGSAPSSGGDNCSWMILSSPPKKTWNNITVTLDQNISSVSGEKKIYLNGLLKLSCQYNNKAISSLDSLFLGIDGYKGKMDDLGIWNRVLNYCELGSIKNTQIVLPSSGTIGSNIIMNTLTPLDIIQWQSNSNDIGWINLVNNSKYNGVTNDTLTISSLQLSNHNQAFRAIACSDTSNIAYINIIDTCITKLTKYDTIKATKYDTITTKITKYDTIKVMDTLVINANLSGISAPNNTNRIIVYPNPAKDHITIDYGVFSKMNGYTVTITNTLGQTVFTTPINQQSSFINLSSWTGKGVYSLQILDKQNNIIENRKIILQ